MKLRALSKVRLHVVIRSSDLLMPDRADLITHSMFKLAISCWCTGINLL